MRDKHSEDIEQAVEIYISRKNSFSLEELFEYLHAHNYSLRKSDRKHITSLLYNSGSLLKDPDKDRYISRASFFNGITFTIQPASFELKNNILIPGHRFLGFSNPENYPWETSVKTERNTFLKLKKFKADVKDLINFYTFFNYHKMFSLFLADIPENQKLFVENGYNSALISVFDMKDYYRNYNMKAGDAVETTVLDWENSTFSFKFLGGNKKEKKKCRDRWIEKLDRALIRSFELSGPLAADSQTAYAFYFMGKETDSSPCLHPENYLKETKKTGLSDYHGLRCFWYKDSNPESALFERENNEIQEQGTTYSIDAILKDTGNILREGDITAYILEEFFQPEGSVDNAARRIFPESGEHFVNPFQKETFYRYLNEIWDNLIRGYNRIGDEKSGEIREKTLILMDRILVMLRKTGGYDISEIQADKAAARLKPLQYALSRLLDELNKKRFLSDSVIREFTEILEDLDNQTTAIEKELRQLL